MQESCWWTSVKGRWWSDSKALRQEESNAWRSIPFRSRPSKEGTSHGAAHNYATLISPRTSYVCITLSPLLQAHCSVATQKACMLFSSLTQSSEAFLLSVRLLQVMHGPQQLAQIRAKQGQSPTRPLTARFEPLMSSDSLHAHVSSQTPHFLMTQRQAGCLMDCPAG